jgi:glycosyltransferase involved in cell wall biosynthesis
MISTLPINGYTGWGVYGANLAIHALENQIIPVMALPPELGSLAPELRAALAAAEPIRRQIDSPSSKHTAAGIPFDGPILVAAQNQFKTTVFDWNLKPTQQFAAIFFENPALTAEAVQKAKTFNKVFTGSTWNQNVLNRLGVQNVKTILQGIDPAIFHPARKSGMWGNAFVIFSGGKLEYRKGQDIVVAAFREFSRRHSDVILVYSWHNINPITMNEIDTAGLVAGIPQKGENNLADFPSWLGRQNVGSSHDIGPKFNWQMAPFLREADVAVFPNRAEGGTNLVAMECMACGIPTVLSANTGHLDLISDQVCFPLTKQLPARPTSFFTNVEQWGESSVDELLEILEKIYLDRPAALRRGAAAAEAMKQLSWENQIKKILAEMNLIAS